MAAKDLTAIGLEILQTARNELYLNLPLSLIHISEPTRPY